MRLGPRSSMSLRHPDLTQEGAKGQGCGVDLDQIKLYSGSTDLSGGGDESGSMKKPRPNIKPHLRKCMLTS